MLVTVKNIQKKTIKKNFLKKWKLIKLQNIYNLNILTTKTNIFISITTFLQGHTVVVKSAKMLGYQHTRKRLFLAWQEVFTSVIHSFMKKMAILSMETIPLLIRLTGSQYFRYKKLLQSLIEKYKAQIFGIIIKLDSPHNGCKLKIKKRRKNKRKKSKKVYVAHTLQLKASKLPSFAQTS